MTVPIYDLRFAYKFDNPFPDDPNRDKLKRLQKYLAANQDKFTEVNYLTDSRYLIICPDTKQLFGKEITYGNYDVSNNPITNYVKDFLASIDILSPEMKQWAKIRTAPKQEPINTSSTNSNNNDNDEYDTDEDNNNNEAADDGLNQQYGDYIPLMPNKYQFNSTLSITNYDISNEKAISFEDLRKLTINIARSRLVPEIAKDETVLRLEQEKRKQLIQQITRYRNVRAIAALDDSDLTEKSIAELEACLEQCIKHHENFKTLELFKRGFAVGGVAYDMIFPDGIPISKTKRLKFNGVGKEILSTLFDPHTSVGLAFNNILQKHNIHVSDELLTLVAFAGICVSKVKVEDVEPSADEEPTVSNGNELHVVNQQSMASVDYDNDDSDLESVSDED